MPTGTGYNPSKVSDFEKEKLEFSGQSIYFESTHETEFQQSDLLLTEDYLITGGMLLVKNGSFEDKIYMQVVHPIVGVVNEFITGYRIVEGVQKQFQIELPYPAKLEAGLSIRCKYVPDQSQQGTRDIAVNLYLHKILI